MVHSPPSIPPLCHKPAVPHTGSVLCPWLPEHRAEATGSCNKQRGQTGDAVFRVSLTVNQLSPYILGCVHCALKHLVSLSLGVQSPSTSMPGVLVATKPLPGKLGTVSRLLGPSTVLGICALTSGESHGSVSFTHCSPFPPQHLLATPPMPLICGIPEKRGAARKSIYIPLFVSASF